MPLQRRIDAYAERLQQQTIRKLEASIGREIRYESIAPSILLFLEVRGIEIRRPEGERNLQLETIRVHYALSELLQGRIGEAISAVRIMDTELRLDARQDRALLEEMGKLLVGGEGNGTGTPPELRLTGENLTIHYTTPDASYMLEELFFTARYDARSRQYRLEGEGLVQGEFDGGHALGEFTLSRLRSRFSLDGTADTAFRNLDARLSLQAFESNLLDFRGLTIELNRDPGTTVIRKIEDSSPWDLQFNLDHEAETVTVALAAKEFVPADNIQSHAELAPYGLWLNTKISGEARFTAGFDASIRDYAANLRLFMDNRRLPEPLSVALTAEGTSEWVRFEPLAIESPSGSIRYRGSLDLQSYLPDGVLNIDRFRWRDYRIAGSLRLNSSDRSLELRAGQLSVNSLHLRNLRAALQLSPSVVEFDLSSDLSSRQKAYDSSSPPDQGGRLSGQGSYEREAGGLLDLSLEMGEVAVAPLVRALLPEALPEDLPIGGLRASSELYLSTDFERYSFSLLPLEVRDEGGAFALSASISGNNNSILVEQLALEAQERSFQGRMQVDRLRDRALRFEASLSHRSRSYTLEGSYRHPSTILFRGNHGLRGTVFLGKERTSFSIQTAAYPLALAEQPTELTLRANGNFSSFDDWHIRARELRAVNLPGLREASSLSLSLRAHPSGIQLSEIVYRDELSVLRGEGEVQMTAPFRPEGRAWLRLQNGEGSEYYRGVLTLEEERLRGQLEVQALPLARFGGIGLTGEMGTSIVIGGTRANPRVEYALELTDAQLNAASVALSARGTATPRQVTLEEVSGEYRNHLLQSGRARLELPSGRFSVSGDYRGILRNQRASADITAQGEFDGLDSLGKLESILERRMTARLQLSSIELFDQQLDPWEFRFVKAETMQLQGGPEGAIEAEMQADGSFSVSLAAPLPVRMEGQGSLRDGELSMEVRELWMEMETINTLGINAVDFQSGTISGRLRIEGPSGDPEFFGELRVNEISGEVRYVNGTVRPFSTNVSISGKTGTFEPVEISAGGQQARFSGGLRFDRWTPNSLRIDIRTLSQKGVEMNYVIEQSGLIARGYARGTFTYALEGTLNRIEGDLNISDFTITMQDKGPPPLMGNQQYRVDLNLTTGPNVQFLWPRSNFPILRAYMKTGQSVNVQYRNNPQRYTIRGDMELRGGELYYFQRNFYLTEGAIHLNEDENAFNPLVELRARIREVDNTGQPVTIFLIVENEPLKTFTPRFESQPVLGTAEIMRLLGAQLYSQFDSDRADLASALLLTGDVFSQFGIIRSFEQQMKETLRLDLFSIRTQMIQNVILDRVLDQPLTDTAQQLSPAERYLDNTTLFLGKYLGNDLFLEGMVQLRRAPVFEEELDDSGLDVHMEIGFEWQTPLFLLNFSVNPDFTDPVQSIDNTSLGFSWDYSY